MAEYTTYTFVLAKRNGDAVAELTNASGRSLQRQLNGIDTASATIALTGAAADYLMNPDNEALLRVYRSDGRNYPKLIFYGPVVDVETIYGPSSGSIQINAASPIWYLTHRFLKSIDSSGRARPIQYVDVMRSQIAHQAVVGAASSFVGMDISPGYPQTSTISIEDASWRTVADLLTEMSAGSIGGGNGVGDGFDFWVSPSELPGGKMGTFYMANRRGQERQDAIFEVGIGTRNNAVEARQAATRSGLANHVFHVPGVYDQQAIDDPDTPKKAVVSAQESGSITDRGLHEAVLRDDIESDAYRQKLVELHASVRRLPRKAITFQPAPEEMGESVPRAGVDFDIGDIVTLRVVAPNGRVAVNGAVRVYGIDTDIDDQSGTGRHTLTLTPQD